MNKRLNLILFSAIATISLGVFVPSVGVAGGISSIASSTAVQGMTSGTTSAAAGLKFQQAAKATQGPMKVVDYTLSVLSYTAAAAGFASAAGDSSTASSTDGGGAACPSGDTCTSTTPTTTTPSTDPGDGLTAGSPTADDGLSSTQTALNTLAGDGYSYNPATGDVTTPSGSYPASDFASGQAMANAGIIPKSEIALANKALGQLKAISMGIKAGGGGGGSSAQAQIQYYNPNAGMRNNRLAIPKAQTAGLTRQLADGELIGSQSDNIFAMVHREYVQLTNQGEFIEKK